MGVGEEGDGWGPHKGSGLHRCCSSPSLISPSRHRICQGHFQGWGSRDYLSFYNDVSSETGRRRAILALGNLEGWAGKLGSSMLASNCAARDMYDMSDMIVLWDMKGRKKSSCLTQAMHAI